MNVLALALVPFLTSAPAEGAKVLKIDPVHSSVLFSVMHNGVARFYGRFNEIQGTIEFDGANPSESSVIVTIPTASVDTHNEKRDNHLKSPDFFNSRQFPEISFVSKTVKKMGDSQYEIEGEFMLHGVTKTLSVTAELVGKAEGKSGEALFGFEIRFSIMRSDYEMKFGLGQSLGDEVQIILSLEAGEQ